MDQSLRLLCDTLTKILRTLNPDEQAVSFMLLTGKSGQGKSSLLRQSRYEHLLVDAERRADIFFTTNSVIVELGESWIHQSKHLLQYTLKQLNACHRFIKITGIMLCIDINELFLAEPTEFHQQSKHHAEFIERFGLNLGYRVDISIIFTKLDALAGFCDFFQHDHPAELAQPFGFSLHAIQSKQLLNDLYKQQFDQFV